ncbi:tetratricopeptide repeat protein [Actinoplanes sp. NPDC051470]|uniref:tetratricopeptide repeat protein n=1 Tax=Actinoplanes sp. NPDC051470 TaxID=3157224 RepID=UPI0034212800
MNYIEDAQAAFRAGRTELAARWSRAGLDRARADADVPAEIGALCMLARLALRERQFSDAWRRADEARALAAGLPDRGAEQMPLHIEAATARMSGDLAYARTLYRQSIALGRETGNARMVATEHLNLGYVELHSGDVESARELFAQAQAQALEMGYEQILPDLALGAAVLSATDGEPGRAARLLGAADAGYAALGRIPDPDDDDEREGLLSELRRTLERDDLDAALGAGAGAGIQRALTEWGQRAG